jgi:ribose transport system substrate-binding protein
VWVFEEESVVSIRYVLVAACVASVIASGCGSSSSSESSKPAAAAASGGGGGGDGALVAEAKKNLAANYAGTDRALPTAAPKPPAGKKLWIITCSAGAEGCAAPAAGVAEAAKVLGWTSRTVDGKLDPARFNAAIREAIAAKADAIVLSSVDCAATKASLAAAKKAGIKIAGLYALDCDDTYAGSGKKLFDAEIQYAGGQTYGPYTEGPYAQSGADYVIAKSNGKADVVAVHEDDVASVRHISAGFEKRIKECSGCKLTTVPITGADLLGGKLQGKVQTALTQHPTATYVFSPYDAAVTLGVAAGVKASGRDRQITLVGSEGLSPNIKMIASGSGQDVALGAPARWAGWAAVDELVRAFAGEPLVDEGIGIKTIDKDHPIPTQTPFYDGNGKADYEANFRKIWGLGA